MSEIRLLKSICFLLAIVIASCQVGCEKILEEDSFYEHHVPAEKLQRIETFDPGQARVEDDAEQEAVAEDEEVSGDVIVSLEDCRATALENNLALKVQLISPTIAAENLSAEEAKFESAIYANAGVTRSDQPFQAFIPLGDNVLIPSIQGSQAERYYDNLGVQVPLQTGGTLTFNMSETRSKQLRENSPSSPWYTNDFSVSLSHPLLRNAGHRANMHSIRIARYAKQIADNATKLEVIRVLAAADRAYWRLYAARRELEVRQQQYELANAQLERAKRFVLAGENAPVEILRAEAGVASQLAAIITAENALRDRQREFKRVINKPGMPIESMAVPIPTTEPDPVHFLFDRDILIQKAMENRAELLDLELQLAQDVSTIDYLNNQMLPLATLDYTYNVSAVGPTRTDSYDMLGDKNFENHRVGLSLWVPLGNEQTRSRLRGALYRRRARLASRDSQEQLIKQEVLNTIDQVEANWQQILASRQNAVLQGRVYQAEIRQFEVGLRTSTDVLEAQTNFADAQSSEIMALVAYQISLVDMAFATGTVLGSAKVDWEPLKPEIGVR